jgi:hypothetical protein
MIAVMGRVISTENIATDRTRLMKAMTIALRQLAGRPGFDSEARDLAAFLVLALDGVAAGVERSVQPWEKRGYWLKADRFRMDWGWVEPAALKLRTALMNDDIGGVAGTIATLADKLKDVEVPAKHRLGTPWIGAWDKLNQKAK